MSQSLNTGIDISKELPLAFGRILIGSLLAAIFLRLADRISIRSELPYKTAYYSCLATSTILFFVSLAGAAIFIALGWSQSLVIFPAMILSVPINALIFQRMVKEKDGGFISHRKAMILSLAFYGVILALALILVGSLLAIGYIAK
jgi:hypothetical protein